MKNKTIKFLFIGIVLVTMALFFKEILFIVGLLIKLIVTLLVIIFIYFYVDSKYKNWIWANKVWLWRQLYRTALFLSLKRIATVSLVKCANLCEDLKKLDEAEWYLQTADRLLSKTVQATKQTSTLIQQNYQGYSGEKRLPMVAPEFFRVTQRHWYTLLKQPHLAESIQLDRASIFLRQNNPMKASGIFESLRQADFSNNPLLAGQVAATRGECFRVLNRLSEARTEVLYALEVFKAQNAKRDFGLANLIAGFAFLYSGEFDRANDYLEVAKSGFENQSDAEALAKIYLGLGRIQIGKGSFDTALSCYNSALGYAEKRSLSLNLQWKIHWGLGFLHEKAKNQRKAVEHLEKAVELVQQSKAYFSSDNSKIRYADAANEVLDQLVALYTDMAQGNSNYYEECRFLVEATRGTALLESQERRRRGILTVYEEGYEPAPTRGSLANPDRTVRNGPNQQWKLQNDKKYLRLIYHLFGEKLLILVKQEDQPTLGRLVDFSAASFEESIKSLHNVFGLTRSRSGVAFNRYISGLEALEPIENSEDILEILYKKLIQPIESYVSREIDFLLIEPHKLLWLVPFAALMSPKKRRLCDLHTVVISPSIHLTQSIKSEKRISKVSAASALVIGNPDFSEINYFLNGETVSFLPLPGAEKEAISIATLFSENKSHLLTGKEATTEAFKKFAHQHNIIHLATHGLSNAIDPDESFLVLAESKSEDGFLKPKEISQLSLIADLVVLSACQTGIGKITGDGIAGTSRSFLIAGARSVLVSLWKIDDNATAELMRFFYQFYLNGHTKAEALRLSMLELKINPNYSHPKYWSGFYLVGIDD